MPWSGINQDYVNYSLFHFGMEMLCTICIICNMFIVKFELKMPCESWRN